MAQENFVLKTCFMESFDGEKLYTEIYLPDENGKYPVICIRDPYVQKPTGTEQERKDLFAAQAGRLGKGFAVGDIYCAVGNGVTAVGGKLGKAFAVVACRPGGRKVKFTFILI